VSISTTASTTPGAAGSVSASSGLSSLNQADFIKLLTAQLQNQDPTSPTKPQDLANEFAQLSTVSGINSLNQQVQSISAGAGAGEIGQAANLIGKTVAVSGDPAIVADSNGTLSGGFSLSSQAASATVSITDPASGKVVHTITMANLPSGMNDFAWSGGTAGHTYTYAVSATSGARSVASTTYLNARVSNVNLTGGTPTLTLAGASQPVDLSQIVSIFGG